jgi:membrane protein DedA with SNARE-associated domain
VSDFDAFLEGYGLAAAFAIMLAKAAGVPIPVPGDVVLLATAARAAAGTLGLGEAFAALLLALVAGGLVQFGLARGPGRGALYRFGRLLGLSPARLDAAAGVVRRGGPPGIALALLTPGVRSVAVPACGVANLPVRVFLAGLVLGSSLDVGLHFLVGYLGWPLVAGLGAAVPAPWALALPAVGLAAWVAVRRRQRPGAPAAAVVAEAAGAWEQATCPVCLALGSLRPSAATGPLPEPRGP